MTQLPHYKINKGKKLKFLTTNLHNAMQITNKNTEKHTETLTNENSIPTERAKNKYQVTNALQEQLGEDDPDAKLLVTTTTGNPIKDMVTTRGKVFAGALPKETHCSCRNKRNNRGIILPLKKCVYAEYCSKKNIGS